MKLWDKTFTRVDLQKRIADLRQLADARPFELQEGAERGTRGVLLRSAGGFEMEVLTDRGMSINHIVYNGIPLAYKSPVGALHPSFYEPEGGNWGRTWMGGFSTICGLTQVGLPCTDGNEELGQHGRAAHLPASQVRYGGEWMGDDYQVWVEGTIREAAALGTNVTMQRRITMKLGDPCFTIEDRIENCGVAPAPHMILQHFNLGYPLLTNGTRLELPSRITQPRDDEARVGLDHCLEYFDPIPGYKPQVFYHDLTPDAEGKVTLKLVNPAFNQGQGLGMYWRYRKADYPVLVQWKMLCQGMYVAGIGPANCHVMGRCWERENGTLQTLQPGEVRLYTIEVGMLP